MSFSSRNPSFLAFSGLAVAILFTFVGGCAPASGPSVEPADLVVKGGRIATVNEQQPYAEALAVRGDRVVAVGTEQEIEAYLGEGTEVLDLEGRLAVPGLIEGHGHFLGLGQARMQLNLMAVTSWQQVVDMVAAAVAESEPGAWIEGRGWHQEKWDALPEGAVQGLPTHHSVSAVSPDNPVVLRHASGHAVFANAKAMELGGVTKATQPPAGGEIIRDAGGTPIGVFRETAGALVSRQTAPDEAELRRRVELAGEECLAKGITSFQDAGTSLEGVALLRAMAEEGKLPLRLWVMIRDYNERMAPVLADVKVVGHGDEMFTVGGSKHSIDGALGAHGAWLLEPYTDLPESTGLNTMPVETIEESARLALEHGLQLCVHAIGDRANRETLDLFERFYAQQPEAELRWRVEHAQHLSLEDIPRFADMGVIASMQAVHCTSDGPWVPERLGDERSEDGAYVWRKLLDSGAVVTNGTDVPVEDVNPIASFHSAVTRRMRNGEIFYGEQVMSREEALHSYTLAPAYAAFEEELKGSLEVGKLADITVLSKDILTIPEDEILSTEVVTTIVGGKIRYSKP